MSGIDSFYVFLEVASTVFALMKLEVRKYVGENSVQVPHRKKPTEIR